MPNNSGQGSISFGSRTITPAAPTVTAANEGLSLSGTTVQLGNASALSNLPLITSSRHIPMNLATSINLNSSNIATPANRVQFLPTGISVIKNSSTISLIQISDNEFSASQNIMQLRADGQILNTRNNSSGTLPGLLFTDNVQPATAQLTPAILNLIKSSAFAVAPTITLQDTPLANSLSLSTQQITLIDTSTTSPRFVFGTGTAAQQLEWRNAAGNMQLLDSGGINIFSVNKNTANTSIATIGQVGSRIANLLFPGNTSGVITMKPQAAAGTYNFNLPTTAGSVGDLLTSGGGGAAAMTFTAPTGLPYIKLAGTSTATSFIAIDMGANTFSIDQSGNTAFSITPSSYSLGAVSTAFFLSINNLVALTTVIGSSGGLQVLDAGGGNNIFTADSVNGITTGISGGGFTATPWRLGDVTNAAAVLDAANYVNVRINGVDLKLALIL